MQLGTTRIQAGLFPVDTIKKSSEPNLTHSYAPVGNMPSSGPYFLLNNLQPLPQAKNIHIVSSRNS